MFKKIVPIIMLAFLITLGYGVSNVDAAGKRPAGEPAANPCAANPCAANPCAVNPCAVNPCAVNPCAVNPCAVNPCAANPCAANPCAANPCAANPCAAQGITFIRDKPFVEESKLSAMGKRLWKDTSLGTSGLSCSMCHPSGQGLYSEPFPKYVEMTKDFVTLDQMINFCMKNPMKTDYLPWNSREMTALAAYVMANSLPKTPGAPKPAPMTMNPCAANPCAANPCAANPCAANPCATNPCATNPCATNPCATNPCATNPCATNPCAW